jgi:hypothetical protein
MEWQYHLPIRIYNNRLLLLAGYYFGLVLRTSALLTMLADQNMDMSVQIRQVQEINNRYLGSVC